MSLLLPGQSLHMDKYPVFSRPLQSPLVPTGPVKSTASQWEQNVPCANPTGRLPLLAPCLSSHHHQALIKQAGGLRRMFIQSYPSAATAERIGLPPPYPALVGVSW